MSRDSKDNGRPAIDVGERAVAMRDLTLHETHAIDGGDGNGWCAGLAFVWGDYAICVGISV